jgi:hypothetical protein
MANERKIIGRVHVDSAQILILDPVRLTETQHDSVSRALEDDAAVEVWLENEAGEVTVENFLDPPNRTNDGVAIRTGEDGSFAVWAEYDEVGRLTSIGLDIA